jgi:adenylate kinase family enzyme
MEGAPPPIQRIQLLGRPASGKTTAAMFLSERLGIPAVKLDRARKHHRRDPEGLRAHIEAALRPDGRWIADGTLHIEQTALRADIVFILDPPAWVRWPRLIRRQAVHTLHGRRLRRQWRTLVHGLAPNRRFWRRCARIEAANQGRVHRIRGADAGARILEVLAQSSSRSLRTPDDVREASLSPRASHFDAR